MRDQVNSLSQAPSPNQASATKSTPKLPDMTELNNKYEEMSVAFKEESTDANAYILQRRAEFDSRSLSLSASLSHTNSTLTVLLESLISCNNRAHNLAEFQNSIDSIYQEIDGKREKRDLHLRSIREVLGEYSGRLMTQLEVVADVRQRLRNEIETDARAQGNGIRFDMFVNNHPHSVESLVQSLEKVDTLEQQLRSKLNHTSTTAMNLETVLGCVECAETEGAVRAILAGVPLLLQNLQGSCDEIKNNPVGDQLREAIRDLESRLAQLRNDDAVQQKAEEERAASIKSELASLQKLMGTSQI
jgi:hypothetical protein